MSVSIQKLLQEAKEKNLEYYPIVAWAKKGEKVL